MTEKANGWLRLLLPIAVYVIGFAVLWGASQARLGAVEKDLDRKADARVVDERQAAILRELSDIKIILRDLQRARER